LEFVADMSHELHTPLNVIFGFSELIHNQLFGSIRSSYLGYATDIDAAGRHLLDVINDVLDLSTIEAGRYDLAEIWWYSAWWCGRAWACRCCERLKVGCESTTPQCGTAPRCTRTLAR
jgi:K+-sensing histidine kinase KdpD